MKVDTLQDILRNYQRACQRSKACPYRKYIYYEIHRFQKNHGRKSTRNLNLQPELRAPGGTSRDMPVPYLVTWE